jgi:stage II sporulation protein D
MKDVSSVQLSIKTPYEVFDNDKGNVILQGRKFYNLVVRRNFDGLNFGDYILKARSIKLKPKKEGVIYVNQRGFRGEIIIIASADSNITIINYLDIEDYLKGVLYHEISHHWPREALKAQAIVARTYALYESRQNSNKDYDLESTVYSQVYGGINSERARTTQAIEETRNFYLTFQDCPFPAFYHATCGGYTEEAAKLWNIDILPLKGVECRFCTNSPHYQWEVKLSFKDIEEALRGHGYNVGKIKDISIIERNRSGRVQSLRLKDDKSDIYISGKDFRQLFDPNLIRSTNITIKISSEFVYIKGLGWGHGVGLCQWGAYFMARQGYKCDQILKYYYPGAKISSLFSNR